MTTAEYDRSKVTAGNPNQGKYDIIHRTGEMISPCLYCPPPYGWNITCGCLIFTAFNKVMCNSFEALLYRVFKECLLCRKFPTLINATFCREFVCRLVLRANKALGKSDEITICVAL